MAARLDSSGRLSPQTIGVAWLEGLKDITANTVLDHSSFLNALEKLFQNRVLANTPLPELLQDEERRVSGMKYTYSVYVESPSTSLASRVNLFKTGFMQNLSDDSKTTVPEAQRDYYTSTYLPKALEAAKLTHLLEQPEIKEWLKHYYLASAKPGIPQVLEKLHRGYTEDHVASLKSKTEALGTKLYQAFQSNEVTKDDLQELLDRVVKRSHQDSTEDKAFSNPKLNEYFDAYETMAREDYPDRQELFWESRKLLLGAFVKMVSR